MPLANTMPTAKPLKQPTPAKAGFAIRQTALTAVMLACVAATSSLAIAAEPITPDQPKTVQPPPAPDAPAPDTRPLSAAQTALFETPHLQNIPKAETLDYRFSIKGPDAFDDTVAEHIDEIHPDGTKYVSFDYLTGKHRMFFPAVDDFKGNPLLMVFLEYDTRQMKEQLGVAAAYFRDRIRDALVDKATMEPATIELDGKSMPAKRITIKPYASEERLEKLPSVQQKAYSFLLSDDVPGQIFEMKAEMPADTEHGVPAWSETLNFQGEHQ